MLHLVSGNKEKRKTAIEKILNNNSAVHIYADDMADAEIQNLVTTQAGLFGGVEYYVLHSLARVVDLKKILGDFADSQNVIIFSEETVTKPITKSFEKFEATIEAFEVIKKKTVEKFNTFALADALGNRDRKNLWLLLQEALANDAPEAIHGILFWQVKNIALIHSSATNPGMHDFVYRKNKGFAQKFSPQEVQEMSHALISMFHNRDTYRTLDVDLETFVLSL